jgi:hypothetical protein
MIAHVLFGRGVHELRNTLLTVGQNNRESVMKVTRAGGKQIVGGWLLGAVLAVMGATTASAQHAKFVLFGDPAPAAAEVPAQEKFVHPLTSPYYHEDAFVTTDLRLWGVYQSFQNDSVIDGGSAKVYAAEVRLALTDKLQFIANKDGYIDFDAGLTDDSGWNDVAVGLKYNVIQNWQEQFHVSLGAGWELPWGDASVLQNDQELRAFCAVAKGFDKLHLGGTFNYFWAIGGEGSSALGNSDTISWNLHADYWINKWLSPVVEVNGYHVTDRGTETVPFSGLDVANLGGGGDVITLGLGGELRANDWLAFRGAYELPLMANDEAIFGWRLTFSAVISF